MNKFIDSMIICPICKGKMPLYSENDMWRLFLCEICDSRLMIHVRELPAILFLGTSKVIVDNKMVADILKKHFKNGEQNDR